MSLVEISFRVEEICKRYEKYDIDKKREQNAHGDDAFARLYSSVESEIDSVIRKSERLEIEKNRAAAVALNAEVRRSRTRLLEELPKLHKLALKKVKGLSPDDYTTRANLVLGLQERVQTIPDGSTFAAKQGGGWASSASNNKIKFNADENFGEEYFDQTEESNEFRHEYEMRKKKQDNGLDFISEGLDALKELAHAMYEELDRQVPLIDEIDTKVDKTTSDLRNTNVRLKKTLHNVRSNWNFCIDIILLIVILGIVSYLYKQASKSNIYISKFIHRCSGIVFSLLQCIELIN